MKKLSTNEKIVMGVVFVIFVLYAITLIFPFVWVFYNSFKTNKEFFKNVWSLPQTFRFQNWKDAFSLSVNGVKIGGMFINSAIFTICSTSISIFMSSLTAYIIAKYPFKGSNLFYSTAILLMMIPGVGSMAATYKMYCDLGLYDSYIGILIGSFGGFGSGFILLYGFYKNISWSYAEAAFVDGATNYGVYFRIMLPMAIPGLVSVAILTAIGVWNDYFTVYMYAPSKVTIAVGLQGLVTQMQYKANYPLLFAVLIMSILPVIIVFACFQKTIMDNTTVGGLKG